MKKELWLIFSIVFLGLLGFGIVIPTLPFIAERFGAGPARVGILFASYSLFQFIGSPILGSLSDRYGRKPLLTISLLGSAAGFFLIAFANSLAVVFVSRIVDGVTGGNISVAQAYIADITTGSERTKAMGLIGAGFGLGFVFGPILGGFLSTYSFAAPYIAAGILALVDAFLIATVLPESSKINTQSRVGHMFDREMLRKVFTPRSVLYLAAMFFLVTLSFSLLQGMFTLYSQRLFGWGERENGYFFTAIGVVSVITQGVIIRQLVKRFSDKQLVRLSLPFLALSFIMFGIFVSQVIYFVTAVVLAMSFGIFNTSIQAEISNESDEDEQGAVLGTVQGFNALARAIGPVVGGLLFSALAPNAPFLVSGISLGLIFFL